MNPPATSPVQKEGKPMRKHKVPAVIEHHTNSGFFVGVVEATAVPGLVVSPRLRQLPTTREWQFTGGWAVVHAGSGYLIAGSLDVGLGQAREAAELLGELGIDWTQRGEDIRDSGSIREQVGEVVDEVRQAVEEGRPVRAKASSWRRCPPGWEIVLRDAHSDEIEAFTEFTYADAEDSAVELGNAHGLYEPFLRRGLVADITVQRARDSEWELTCARRDCPEALGHAAYGGPIRFATRSLLAEMASAEGWQRLDQLRWLCPDCRPLYHQA